MFGINVWSPTFVRDDFVDDNTLISFFNKFNGAKLGYTSLLIKKGGTLDMVRWGLNPERGFTALVV